MCSKSTVHKKNAIYGVFAYHLVNGEQYCNFICMFVCYNELSPFVRFISDGLYRISSDPFPTKSLKNCQGNIIGSKVSTETNTHIPNPKYASSSILYQDVTPCSPMSGSLYSFHVCPQSLYWTKQHPWSGQGCYKPVVSPLSVCASSTNLFLIFNFYYPSLRLFNNGRISKFKVSSEASWWNDQIYHIFF